MDVQKELLHYPWWGWEGVGGGGGSGIGISKMSKFYVKDFYVMGKVLSGKLSCTQTGLLKFLM